MRDVVPLTGTEIAVIRQIHRAPRSTPSQIAESTGLRRSNVSTAIRALEAGGLVVREQLAGNARSVALVPTARAAESVARINAYWAALLHDVPADLLRAGVEAAPALAGISRAIVRRADPER
nr:MarR family transcriptional regulator [Aeromicrobium wangtongii]